MTECASAGQYNPKDVRLGNECLILVCSKTKKIRIFFENDEEAQNLHLLIIELQGYAEDRFKQYKVRKRLLNLNHSDILIC